MSILTQPITLQSLFGQNRTIGEITVDVVVKEDTNDTLTITKQPVQQGASITDHAYKEPTVLSMSIFFQDNFLVSLSKLYKELLDLQTNRVPFTVTTPKRIYESMLIATLSQTTDKYTENCLALNVTFQEVILVSVGVVEVPRTKQRFPGTTGATQPAGKKSLLRSGADGIGLLRGQGL